MYSTNMKDDRYLSHCVAVSRRAHVIDFIIDTGAKFTCCNYKALDKRIRECELADCVIKHIGGLIQGETVKFYKYRLKQVIMIANPYNHRLYFCKDVEDYSNNFELAVS